MISREVLQLIRSTFILDWQGIHGLPHWSRVRVNGLQIARNNTADQKVVELFAFLHDVKREVDFNDPEHDPRAAAFIHSLPDTLLNIRPVQKERLEYACYYHSRGLTEADITIQTCWDADRLDLGGAVCVRTPKNSVRILQKIRNFLNRLIKEQLTGTENRVLQIKNPFSRSGNQVKVLQNVTLGYNSDYETACTGSV